MAYSPISCVGCQVTVQPTSGKQLRCPPCAWEAKIKRGTELRCEKAGRRAGVVACVDCSAECPRRGPTQQRCTSCSTERKRVLHLDAQMRRYRAIVGTEAYREKTRAARRRRRAREQGVLSLPYKSADIYERDGWVCHICSLPIDPTIQHPNRNGHSIDHIIPIFLGGPDTPANVRAAHMGCNSRRGWRGFLILEDGSRAS